MLEACPQCLSENFNDRSAQGEASLGKKTKAQGSHFAQERPGSQEVALPLCASPLSVSVFFNAAAQLPMGSFEEGRDGIPWFPAL